MQIDIKLAGLTLTTNYRIEGENRPATAESPAEYKEVVDIEVVGEGVMYIEDWDYGGQPLRDYLEAVIREEEGL